MGANDDPDSPSRPKDVPEPKLYPRTEEES
jgi:hypothetical protein